MVKLKEQLNNDKEYLTVRFSEFNYDFDVLSNSFGELKGWNIHRIPKSSKNRENFPFVQKLWNIINDRCHLKINMEKLRN